MPQKKRHKDKPATDAQKQGYDSILINGYHTLQRCKHRDRCDVGPIRSEEKCSTGALSILLPIPGFSREEV